MYKRQLLICAAFFAVCVLVFFNVGEIELIGLERCDETAVRAALGVSPGDNLFSFRAGDVESALKKAFPYIGSVEVTRGFPTTLTVTVQEEIPVTYVEQYGEYFILSRELKVLERRADKPCLLYTSGYGCARAFRASSYVCHGGEYEQPHRAPVVRTAGS